MVGFDALIVEDEQDHIDILTLLLSQYFEEITVIGTARSIEEAKKFLKEVKPEIIFLDMNLNGENSFRILEKMANLHEVEIIVTSSHREYAIEAFKHLATDYILKPLKAEDLMLALKKAKRNIELRKLASSKNELPENNAPLKFLAIPSMEDVEIISIDQLVYLESDGRYTVFHLKDKTSKIASKNLGEYEKLLNNNNFFRIHHSLLVNMDFAMNIHKKDGNYLKMTTQKYLPISKRRINSLYRFLNLK
ncbi:LytR/AlgR family response regulator transcription factor [Ascidiimonas sp. W6]|uniref:LytR/AlgR family response regulator transcription factor n=1 Tax=Ascidiimonas meishanensis TaxID=3128903 RepID=UPI0030EEC7A9